MVSSNQTEAGRGQATHRSHENTVECEAEAALGQREGAAGGYVRHELLELLGRAALHAFFRQVCHEVVPRADHLVDHVREVELVSPARLAGRIKHRQNKLAEQRGRGEAVRADIRQVGHGILFVHLGYQFVDVQP